MMAMLHSIWSVQPSSGATCTRLTSRALTWKHPRALRCCSPTGRTLSAGPSSRAALALVLKVVRGGTQSAQRLIEVEAGQSVPQLVKLLTSTLGQTCIPQRQATQRHSRTRGQAAHSCRACCMRAAAATPTPVPRAKHTVEQQAVRSSCRRYRELDGRGAPLCGRWAVPPQCAQCQAPACRARRAYAVASRPVTHARHCALRASSLGGRFPLAGGHRHGLSSTRRAICQHHASQGRRRSRRA